MTLSRVQQLEFTMGASQIHYSKLKPCLDVFYHMILFLKRERERERSLIYLWLNPLFWIEGREIILKLNSNGVYYYALSLLLKLHLSLELDSQCLGPRKIHYGPDRYISGVGRSFFKTCIPKQVLNVLLLVKDMLSLYRGGHKRQR